MSSLFEELRCVDIYHTSLPYEKCLPLIGMIPNHKYWVSIGASVGADFGGMRFYSNATPKSAL